MDGFGRNEELPADLKTTVKGVMIFHGNPAPDDGAADGRGIWTELRPGHGTGFKSDGKRVALSNRFGVELSFARRLQQLDPESAVAIIKYSRGGTSIHSDAAGDAGCWEPDYKGGKGVGEGINQYDHFLATVRKALSIGDIDGDGHRDRLTPTGILWMQGESDASFSEEIARLYEDNLRRLIALFRTEFRAPDMPVVVGRISDSGRGREDRRVWRYGDIVRGAQAAFVETDGHAALVVSTDEYRYSDRWHYDSNGFIDLGRRFAEKMLKLQSIPASVKEH